MSFLELKIPPVILVALFALAMWLLAPLTASFTIPTVFSVMLALCLAVTGIAVALAGVLAFRRDRKSVV